MCRACAAHFTHWFRADPAADALPPGLPVWAVAAYADEAARVVMAWKSGHRPDLAPPLHRLARRMAARLAVELTAAQEEPPKVLLVPAPSGWRRRWRGNEVVLPLAQHLAAGLREQGLGAGVGNLLRRRGGGRHHLGASARRKERAAAITLRRSATVADGAAAVLVDDVLTTGATLGASAQAIGHIAEVRGAIVLAATPRPVSSSG